MGTERKGAANWGMREGLGGENWGKERWGRNLEDERRGWELGR